MPSQHSFQYEREFISRGRVHQLSYQQERELIGSAQLGDIDARNKLLESHLPFIYYWMKLLVGIDHRLFYDLIQEGVLGDIHGIERFDLNYKVRYHAYGYWWVRAFAKSYLQKETRIFNHEVSLRSDEFGMPVSVFEVLDDSEILQLELQDEMLPNDLVVVSMLDILAEYRDGFLIQGLDLLTEIMRICNGDLTNIQKQILAKYYHQCKTNKKIGTELGLSDRWVSVLKYRALDAIRNRVQLMLASDA